jgi:hypothetical protein
MEVFDSLVGYPVIVMVKMFITIRPVPSVPWTSPSGMDLRRKTVDLLKDQPLFSHFNLLHEEASFKLSFSSPWSLLLCIFHRFACFLTMPFAYLDIVPDPMLHIGIFSQLSMTGLCLLFSYQTQSMVCWAKTPNQHIESRSLSYPMRTVVLGQRW